MIRYSHRFLFAVASIFMAALCSCIYEDAPPCDLDEVDIFIENDWEYARGAAPEGMAYMFFRTGISSPWRFDFPGIDAGKVSLPPGEYGFVMFNDDTSDIVFKTMAGGMPFVTTSSEKINFDDHDIEVFETPDMMWSASVREVCVGSEGVEYSSGDTVAGGKGSYLLKTMPRQITPEYIVKVLHVDNLQGVAAMKGLISGMADGINLYEEISSENEAKLCFSPHIAPDSTVVAGFNTFGLPFHRKISNELRLYFLLSDSRLVCHTFDVTDRVVSSPDPMHVEIVIDSIYLPFAPPPSTPGAFDPTVAGWTTVIVNLGT